MRRDPVSSLAVVVAVLLLLNLVPNGGSTVPSRPPASAPSPAVRAHALPIVSCAARTCGAGRPVAPLPSRFAFAASSLGSTPTNRYIANWTREGALAENPSNPLNLVAVGIDHGYAGANNSTGSTANGGIGIFVSWDGGNTWSDGYAPANGTHLNTLDPTVAFGPNNRVYVVCMDSGFGMVSSPDGGRTWGTMRYLYPAIGGNDKDWLVVDPSSGELYLAYYVGDAGEVANSTDGGRTWTVHSLGNSGRAWGEQLAIGRDGAINVGWVDWISNRMYFARAVDDQLAFSTPLRVATVPGLNPCSADGHLCQVSLPSLAVGDRSGTGPADPLYMVWENGTTGMTALANISFSRSSDNGSSWSPPLQVNTIPGLFNLEPAVAVGPDGTVWVQWYGQSRTNASFYLYASASHDGGVSFEPSFRVSDAPSEPINGSTNLGVLGDYVNPGAGALGVHALWVDMRGVPDSAERHCVYPQCESDEWDTNSSFYTAELVTARLGSTVPAMITVNGTVPGTRAILAGPSPVPIDGIVGAAFELTAPATVSVNGSVRYFASWFGTVNSTSPTIRGTVTGPIGFTACYATALNGRCPWLGTLAITVRPSGARVTVDGRPLPLQAGGVAVNETPGTYTVSASAPGYAPASLNVSVTPANTTFVNLTLARPPGLLEGVIIPGSANLSVNGTDRPVAIDGSFSVVLPAGTYTVRAWKYGYADFLADSVQVQAAQATVLDILLTGEPGWINGTVNFPGATLTLNGRPLAASGGVFAAEVPVGVYWVNATAVGYVPASTGPLTVVPFGRVHVDLNLTVEPGVLEGNVSPESASVYLDGGALPVVAGTFSATLAPGSYWLNVSASGFTPRDQPVNVAGGSSTEVSVRLLTAPGWLAGVVHPLGASVTVDAVLVPLGGAGEFNLSTTAGTHQLNASSAGFATLHQLVTVEAGRSQNVSISLVASRAPTPAAGSWTLLGLAGAAAVVAAAAAVGVLLGRRRRRPEPTVGGRSPANELR
ncbi:MAG: PEGA domain-containing protein [Thermoplasmata archaeon]|nr:PEGA domain-containing protein [Thermoplasmata archaeon]